MNKKQKLMLVALAVLIVILFFLLGKEKTLAYYNTIADKVAEVLPSPVTFNVPSLGEYVPVDYGVPDSLISNCNMCGTSYSSILPASFNNQVASIAAGMNEQQVVQQTTYVYGIANNVRPFGGGGYNMASYGASG
jgi:hypothetical protein